MEGNISLKADGGYLYSTIVAFLRSCYYSRVAGAVLKFLFLALSYLYLYSTIVAFLRSCYRSRVAGAVLKFLFLALSYFVGGTWRLWVVYFRNLVVACR